MKNLFKFIYIFPLIALALGNPDEKQVNTFTKSYQREPVISQPAKDGSFIVVWTSNLQDGDGEGIFAQYFDHKLNKIGKEFCINNSAKFNQNKPAVAMNNNGDCVVTWATTKPDNNLQDIYCRMFSRKNKKAKKEFLVNTVTDKSQNSPDVAIDAKGNFIIVWHSWDQDGSDRGIFAQRFDQNGTKLGKEFQVNTHTKFSQCEPSISMAPDGRFIVAWQSWGQENPSDSIKADYGIYAQLFDQNGNRIGDEIHVNTTTKDDQFYPDAAMNKSGEFIIAWTSWDSESKNYSEIFAQRFDSMGNKKGEEFIANITLPEYQWLPSVAINDDDSFSIAWGSWKQDKSREGVYLQSFNSKGEKENQELQINVYTESYQWEPQIITGKDGCIIAVYSSWNQDGDDYGIFIKKATNR